MNIEIPPQQHKFLNKTPMGVEYSREGVTSYKLHRKPHHTNLQIADSIKYLAKNGAVHISFPKLKN